MATGHVLDDVFVDEDIVGGAHQGIVAEVNFRLPCGSDLVVVLLHLDAEARQFQGDLRADVLEGIGRGNGEISLFVAGAVAQVQVPP
ncbi:hypothetical protein HRbin23_01590 [bacterium HR23]|nr:hypothetical protein HRbin23_01590 [bacterium HR23]